MTEQKNIIAVDEFGGKYFINEFYRPIAEALQEKFKELKYVPVKSILFIENREDKRKKNNSIVFAQISKVPGKWEEIIYQLTGRYFEYILEIFRENIIEMSREQIIALMYHELRHIQQVKTKDGIKIDIVSHEVEDWINMVEKLGLNWATTKGYIQDLLDKDINWDNIQGPKTLFPAETALKLVK